MAKKSKKGNAISGVKGIDKSVAKHANDAVNYGNASLPGGIKGGIAKLVTFEFKEYARGPNEGKPFAQASGIVVKPTEFKGLRTWYMEPICDTETRAGKETSQDDHIGRVMNTMMVLGADTDDADDGEDLLELANDLVKEAPHFMFETSQGKTSKEFPNPTIFENWGKAMEDYDPDEDEESDDEDDDDSEEVDDEEDEETEEVDEEEESEEDDDDEEEEEDEEEEDGDEAPEKGDNYLYKPPKKKKAVECVVTTVNATTETCTLKNLDDDTRYKQVSWDDMEIVD